LKFEVVDQIASRKTGIIFKNKMNVKFQLITTDSWKGCNQEEGLRRLKSFL